MKLVQSKYANINYLSKIVYIETFHSHPDPEVTKLKCTYVDGYNIIVGIDSEPGYFVYFPTSSQINPQLLSYANLYRHNDKNSNTSVTGMFEDNGRVKAIKLRGCVSEGFLLPFDVFNNWIITNTQIGLSKEDINNIEFDSVEHNNKSFWVSRKYIVRQNNSIRSSASRHDKVVKKFDRLIEGQFRFHYDTEQIKKLKNPLCPTDLIHISSKWHGTSGISAYVLTKKPIGLFKRICNYFAGHGFADWEPVYDYLYSSRSVIKNKYVNKNVTGGYYGCDVWKYADNILRPTLEKGMSYYYEIVGYTPNGNYIQKDYDYGCVPPESENNYIYDKNFKIRIYRITLTNPDGKVYEFSPREVQIWCEKHNLIPVTQLYYGYANDLYPQLLDSTCLMDIETWNREFIEKLAEEKRFYMEQKSPDCNNNVPHEGIVIKIDNMVPAAMKLKSFKFLNKEQQELDKGISNMEDDN